MSGKQNLKQNIFGTEVSEAEYFRTKSVIFHSRVVIQFWPHELQVQVLINLIHEGLNSLKKKKF